MWAVMKVQSFKLLEFEVKGLPPHFQNPIDIKVVEGKEVGYLPVYNTLEDAKEDFPNGPFQEVTTK